MRLAMAWLVLAAGGTLCGCAAPSPRADGKLSVVAGESPWGAVAAAVGGSRVSVTSLISAPGSDPHEYVASAPAAAAVATADVVVENGLGYDAFIDRLLATGATHHRVVVNAASVLKVSGADANPHLFYAVLRVGDVARAIANAFEQVDPAHRAEYEANLAAFISALAPVCAQVAAIRMTYGGEGVAQTERVAGYLLEEAGLAIIGPTGFTRAIEDGQEPNAGDQRALDTLLAGHRLAAFVVRTGPQNSAVEQAITLAQSHGVGIVTASELVRPQGATYVAWMGHEVSALSAVLQGAK